MLNLDKILARSMSNLIQEIVRINRYFNNFIIISSATPARVSRALFSHRVHCSLSGTLPSHRQSTANFLHQLDAHIMFTEYILSKLVRFVNIACRKNSFLGFSDYLCDKLVSQQLNLYHTQAVAKVKKLWVLQSCNNTRN